MHNIYFYGIYVYHIQISKTWPCGGFMWVKQNLGKGMKFI